jgi:hypothetical protein
MKTPAIARAAGVCVALAAAGAGHAQTRSFHAMQIEQAMGGVGGDTTAQAVQLRMRSGFQNLVQFARLRVADAQGANPVLLVDFTHSVPNSAAGDRVLIATAAMSSHTTPALVPDFTMTNPIPASYMVAGRLLYEDDSGGILWSLAYGGAAYTGPTTGLTTNDADGDFGPPFAGPLPSGSTSATLFSGPASAPSTTNLADYALTTGPAVFTNNAHQAFTVRGSCAPDFNGDGQVNVSDFLAFLQAFAAGDARADFTQDGQVNVSDFLAFLQAFAQGC